MQRFATYHAEDVDLLLDYPGCISVVREAMATLSASTCDQPLRQIIGLGEGKMFGLMPGTLPSTDCFGAKLVSVFADPQHQGRAAHKGVVAAFDEETGDLLAVADARSVTRIRTGAASAVATDVLAKASSKVLTIVGTGEQALSHLQAIPHLRPFEQIFICGRTVERAEEIAHGQRQHIHADIIATTDVETAVRRADVICTVTTASEPIIFREWVKPGVHLNVVGSSYLGPAEIDNDLVADSRFIVDYRPSALAAAAEFARAKEAGLVTDDHIIGEIGDILNGTIIGRESDNDITIYKSLGHIVQDLAAVRYLHHRASS